MRSNYIKGTGSLLTPTRPRNATCLPCILCPLWLHVHTSAGLWGTRRNKFPITQCVILQMKTSVFKRSCLKGIRKAINCANYKELITSCAIWRALKKKKKGMIIKKSARLAESKKSLWPGCCLGKMCIHFGGSFREGETDLVSVFKASLENVEHVKDHEPFRF